jgi:hypothetical protein
MLDDGGVCVVVNFGRRQGKKTNFLEVRPFIHGRK